MTRKKTSTASSASSTPLTPRPTMTNKRPITTSLLSSLLSPLLSCKPRGTTTWLLYSKIAFPDVLKRAIAEWKAANGCKLPPLNPFDIVYRLNIPAILGFSPASFTPPADWKHFDYAVTGDWVLNADDLPEDAAALVEFIKASKEPPLYIGWGSMEHESGQYMTELAVRTLSTIGKRAHRLR
eukprot:scaffold116900_cov100-Phaeocystis_antarctica.AAC.1